MEIVDVIDLERQSVDARGTKGCCCSAIVVARVENDEIRTRAQHCFDVWTNSRAEVGYFDRFRGINVPVGSTDKTTASSKREDQIRGGRVERYNSLRSRRDDDRI